MAAKISPDTNFLGSLMPEKQTSTDMIVDSFSEIKVNRRCLGTCAIVSIVSLALSFLVLFAQNPIHDFAAFNSVIMNAQLVMTGIILAVYSIIFSIFSNQATLDLSKSDDIQLVARRLKYYQSALFLFFIASIFSISVGCIAEGSVLTELPIHSRLSDLIFVVVLFYFWFQFRVLFELKSVIFNTVELVKYCIVMQLIKQKQPEHAEPNPS